VKLQLVCISRRNLFVPETQKTLLNQWISSVSGPKGALVYGIFQGFASLKTRHFTGRNLYRFSCPGIPSSTRST
jgi:hypothetical protein